MDVLDVFELYSDASESKLKNFEKKLSSNMEVKIETEKPKTELRWVTMMEDTMVYINNILNAPTRLIINEEEVVKIEKIKKVTVESIKHLSRNAGFIEDIDEKGDVRPGKLLNVFKEETYNTYEMRFIFTLIQKMRAIVKKEKSKYVKETKTSNKEYKQFDNKGSSYNGKNKVDIEILVSSSTEESGKSDDVRDLIERMNALEKNIVALTLTSTYIALEKAKVQLVQPPLKKNNVILKNVNFQYAAKLWDFLINEMDSKSEGELECKTKTYKEKGKAKKLVDQTFLLDYLILQAVESPALGVKKKREIIEKLVANMVERTLDVNDSLSEEQLKNLVARQYQVIKVKRQTTNKEIQDIFKKYISKYVLQISDKKNNK